ncbi:MAG: hypothetical protein RMJ67_04130 [Elusimicrobiota bacterium]|nr:hypothetical protein [Endomicrobiia bacterium]MDW8165680.1 hypothetical protein [Elusimicrobiota bacterium]
MKEYKNIINIKTIFITISVIILFLNVIYSLETYTSRGRSIGDSFVSYSLGVEALVYNPAASYYIESPEILVEYENLLPSIRKSLSLNRQLLGGVIPVNLKSDKLCIGLSLAQFNSEIYKENIYYALVSKDITPLLLKVPSKDIKVSLGIKLKYLSFLYPSSELLSSDPLFENFGREKSVFSFDLGVFYTTKDIYHYGLVINDVLEPNVGIKDISYLKRRVLLGFAYKHNITDKNITLLPSLGVRNYFNRTDISFGCEVIYKNSYFLRGTYSNWNVAVGVGYEYKNLVQINYSYVILNELNTFGGHYVSLNYKFSKPTKEKKISNEVKIEEKKQQPTTTLEIKSSTETKTQTDKKTLGDKKTK